MLKFLLLIPRDVVTCQIVPFLDLVSLTRLDTATMSHELRSRVLSHVLTDITTSGDEVCTYSHDLIRWLMCRHVHVRRIMFPEDTTDADLAIAAPAISNAKVLDLTDCNSVTNKGVKTLLESFCVLDTIFLTKCRWLVDGTLHKLADNHPNLTTLHLYDSNYITDSAIIHIADRCTNLMDVRLDSCKQIGDASMQALSRCKLSYLGLEDCPRITEESVLMLIERVGASLKEFYENQNRWVTERFYLALTDHCPNLETLWINETILSEAALDYICSHISTKLTDLYFLECHALTDAHIEQIATRAVNLMFLKTYLSGQLINEQLTDKALISIGTNLPNLYTFNVESSEFSYEGFAALARGCVNIGRFDVYNSGIFCDDCLREIVQNCHKLSYLRIDHTDVSSRGISYVAEYCANLDTIILSSANATEEDVMYLIACCTTLREVSYDRKVSEDLWDMVREVGISLYIRPRVYYDSDRKEIVEEEG